MRRMRALELKRVAKTRSTWLLSAGALLLSTVMAFLVISFARYYYLGENGKEASLSGMDAIQANREIAKPIEGQLTPEKIRTVFETYHKVYDAYGKDIPPEVYYEKIYPISTILTRVREVYVDESTGVPLAYNEISPGDAADFYQQRTVRLRNYMAYKYKGAPDAQQQALAINGQVKTPFSYAYGVGDSDTSDYITFCIFLLVLICTVIAAPIFSAEYQSGADDILRCTKHGRRRLAMVKLLSAVLLTAGLFTVCISAFLTITYTAFGRDSLQTTLQVVRSAICFAPLTVGMVNTLTVLSGLLSFLATICFTLFLSTRLKNPVTTLVIAAGTCLLPTVLMFAGSGGNLESWLKFCLPSGGIGFGTGFYWELTGFSFLRLGASSVWTPYIIPVAAGIEAILFFILAICSYSRHEAS